MVISRPVRAVHLYYDRIRRKWYAEARAGSGLCVEREPFTDRSDAREHAKKLCDKYPRASYVK